MGKYYTKNYINIKQSNRNMNYITSAYIYNHRIYWHNVKSGLNKIEI